MGWRLGRLMPVAEEDEGCPEEGMSPTGAAEEVQLGLLEGLRFAPSGIPPVAIEGDHEFGGAFVGDLPLR